MEIKTDALLLRATDYGENDKMATLFSADRGKLSVCFKGVKKAGAKLRFAAQPFCFAEYVLAEKNSRRTAVSASLYDGFYPLRESVEAFYAASAVCEACDKLLFEGMINGELFLAAVTALKEMCLTSPSFPLVKFLTKALSLAGWGVSAEELCPLCGGPTVVLSGDSRLRFDMESGAFTCAACGQGVPASASTFFTIKAAKTGGASVAEGEKRALRLLYAYLARRAEISLSSLEEYLRLPSV